MKCNPLVLDFIRSADRGWTRIVVIALPESEHAVGFGPAFYINHSGGAEVGPCELLFARPHQLHRLSRCFRQARRFDCAFPCMLSAIGRTGVGNITRTLLSGT